MNSRVSKARTRHSPMKLSQALQETRLDAVASNSENPQGREESPESGDRTEGTTPVQGRQRRRSVDLSIDRSDAKRARLAQTHTQQLEAQDEITEQANNTTILQPIPSPSKRPYASFLDDFLGPG
ncbi:hypothetical protein BR93DRAFT_964430 [Coniochaeta sp. PMI_546]|nr:hypothetical protein BR93DRAFT_964430 [Coniochaeta sp. PMI_546]